jgi:phospholipid-binding lipoprotein MlaA
MRKTLIAITAAALMAGCATTSGTANPRDPWEPFNRSVFKFNDNLDRDIVKPMIDTYTTLVPEFARTGISNFFSNVGDVWVGVNNLLQGKPDQAASDVGRVLVNSTLGVLGLVDVATGMGLKHHNEDFGQTLGRWGAEPGLIWCCRYSGRATYAIASAWWPTFTAIRSAICMTWDGATACGAQVSSMPAPI